MLTMFYTDWNKSTFDEETIGLLFPESIQREIKKYKNNSAAKAALHGKLLLLAGLTYFNYPWQTIDSYQRTANGRPYLSAMALDFNISHSGNLVVIAFSDGRVGLDIEELSILPFEDFDRVFDSIEWKYIGRNPDFFFQFWTIKEAVMKADGRGFGLDPRQISIDLCLGQAKSDKKQWYYHTIEIDTGYILNVVLDKPWNREDLSVARVDGISANTLSKNMNMNLTWL
jgi:4'-phosphopantetheinyl transferase